MQSFLHPPEYELFDLQEDPHEWKNLAASTEHEPIRERLLKAMQKFQREIKDPFGSSENIAEYWASSRGIRGQSHPSLGKPVPEAPKLLPISPCRR